MFIVKKKVFSISIYALSYNLKEELIIRMDNVKV